MDYELILISISLGYALGLLTGLLFHKINYTLEKTISIIIFSVWMTGHIVGFIIDKNIPYIFDILGFATAGNLVGLNLATLLRSFRK